MCVSQAAVSLFVRQHVSQSRCQTPAALQSRRGGGGVRRQWLRQPAVAPAAAAAHT